MRIILAILAMSLVLAGCGDKKPAHQAAKPAAQQAQEREPTVKELDATAAQAEAEATRLEAEASRAPAGNTPGAANATAGTPMALAAGDEKLQTGQYYDTIGFEVQAGQTFNIVYDAQGYQPTLIVLGPDNKPDSQSQGPVPNPTTGQAHVESETKADRAGTWHVLLTSAQPGATGTYRVRIDKVTETH